MDYFDRRLCLGGMLLVFTGCVLGFIVPAYAPHPGMLAAHLNAVQTGIFLLVLALLWPKLQLGSRMSAWLGHLTWISFWLLQACLTLGAYAQVDTVLAALKPVVARQSSAEAALGSRALLQTFNQLLGSLIGPSLTERLLRSALANASSAPPVQDTPP